MEPSASSGGTALGSPLRSLLILSNYLRFLGCAAALPVFFKSAEDWQGSVRELTSEANPQLLQVLKAVGVQLENGLATVIDGLSKNGIS